MSCVWFCGGFVVCHWCPGIFHQKSVVCCGGGFFVEVVSYVGGCARFVWCVNLGCSLVIGKCVFGRCVHACVFRC